MNLSKIFFYSIVTGFIVANALHPHSISASAIDHFISPTERYLSTHELKYILPYMKDYGVTEEHVYAFKDAIANESTGFFGYHGASREFYIYQDIIRIAIEEVLKISIRDDFHFLRFPGDLELVFDSANDYLCQLQVNPENVNDTNHYIRLNISLYENFYFASLSSIPPFVQNAKHSFLEKKLVPFFEQIGISPDAIATAFDIARSKIPNKGVLLQFFDTTNYELVDKFAYCSLSTGKPYFQDRHISEFILDSTQTAFPQIRLVINNKNILNPHSSLKILRYDLYNNYIKTAYSDALRKYIRSLPVDKTQADSYKSKLLKMWE